MWDYKSELQQEITLLLSDAVTSSNNQRQQEIASRILGLYNDPNFPCYLLSILTTPSLTQTIRLASGHTLKSYLEKNPRLSQNVLEYFQQTIIRSLFDESICAAISSIVSTLYITQEGWPQLLAFLSENMLHNNSLIILSGLYEDISTFSALAYLLDTPLYSESNKKIILTALELAKQGNVLALKVLNQLLKIMPTTLMPVVGKYLEVLISSPVSDLVAQGIFAISCSRKDIVKKYFSSCAEIMIQYMNDEKGGVACNF